MVSFPRHNRFFLLVIFFLAFSLAACSSGGGKDKGSSNNSDTTPDAFTLTAPTGIDLAKVTFSTPIVSSPITISGITGAAPVSISGGEYAIGSGSFTSTAGTVTNGQTITVRVQSPVKAGQSATATLNVGGQTATFTVTTDADTTPPEVAILFPPPASMTEGQTLFLRGTVKDVHGTLADGAVTVNGVEAALELNTAGDEGAWSVTVDLAPGENTLTVTAADAAENVNDEESVSSRRVVDIAGESFPDNEVPFEEPISVDIHTLEGSPVALVTDPPAQTIVAVDLLTGERRVFSDNETQSENSLEYPWSIHVGGNGQIYVFDWDVEQPRVYVLDSAGRRELFIEKNEGESAIDQPLGLYLKESPDGEYLYLADRGNLFRVDVQTKAIVVVSDSANGIPNLDNPIADAVGMVFDKSLDRFIVISVGEQRLYSVDARTGERDAIVIDEALTISNGILSPDGKSFVAIDATQNRVAIIDVGSGVVNIVAGPESSAENMFVEPRGVVVHPNDGYVLVVDRVLRALVALDMESNRQVIVSKSE